MSSLTSPLIELKNLDLGYGANRVISEMSLAIEEGEFIGVIGPNGSGKSTFLHGLSGILPPSNGEIRLFNKPYSNFSRRELAQVMAVVEAAETHTFQFSVGELVEMGRTPYLKRLQPFSNQDREAVRKAMEATEVLALESRPINELSSGERQRVFLARALAQETDILLLDEPTTHLDLKHQVESFQFLTQLNREHNLTIICISHDINLASEYCSRLLIFKEGLIIADGSPEEVLTAEVLESVFGKHFFLGNHPQSGRPFVINPAKKK